jgi:polar amino acid transport system substrate-binding protein
MTKRRWLLGALLLAAGGAALWLRSRREEGVPKVDRPLVVGADAEGGAPYIFKSPDNPRENIGFEVDLINALAREMGRPIVVKQYEFNQLVPGLERGDFDVAMNGLEITPDRLRRVRFSRPYYAYKLQLVVRKGEKRFTTVEECRGTDRVIGTLEDTAASRFLDKVGVRRKHYPGQVEPYQDLALGRIDGVLLDLPIALYLARKNPKLEFAGEPIEPGYYALAFRRSDAALTAEVNAALGRLFAKGEVRRIYEKWGLWGPDQEALARGEVRDVVSEPAGAWPLSRYLPLLLEGAAMTVFLTVASMALAVLVGLPLALVRLYAPRPLRLLGLGYVEFFRGTPVLLLLYFLYYGLPVVAAQAGLSVSLSLAPWQAAILGLGLNYAAYEAEIYRAGVHALPAGQWEAAAALGMPAPLTFRRIILPQALRTILPPMTNDFVALFKDTSVVSIIAVVELSKTYQILSKSSFQYLEIGLVTAVLYLLMSVPLGHLSRYLEQRWNAHEKG